MSQRPITAKINVTRILKEHLFPGKNGKYLDLVIWERKDGPDQFGNTHSVQQDIGKSARDAGKQNVYIGSLKMPTTGGAETTQSPPKRSESPQESEDSGCPF